MFLKPILHDAKPIAGPIQPSEPEKPRTKYSTTDKD